MAKQRQKIGDRKTLINLLKINGFKLIDISRHEKWSNNIISVYIPNKHSNGKFSRMLAERIAKEAGIV